MYCLGIESTAHTFGIGIVNEKCEILADEKKSFSSKTEGINPRIVSKHHFENSSIVLENALKKSQLKLKEIDLIAFSKGPGLGHCLEVGAIFSRYLALKIKKPLIGVNHCIAHIEIGKKIANCSNPIIVYVSGGNTQIIGLENKKYRIFGETLDIGLGNLLDMFGREIGIGFPAGPILDKMYFDSSKFTELPYTVKGTDIAFSGLFTAAKNKIGKTSTKDLVHGLMHNAFCMTTEVTERALAHTEKKEVLLAGGVGASKAFQSILEKMCSERKAKLFVTPKEYCTDNGAMIAWLGILMHKAGNKMKFSDCVSKQRFRTDETTVNWE